MCNANSGAAHVHNTIYVKLASYQNDRINNQSTTYNWKLNQRSTFISTILWAADPVKNGGMSVPTFSRLLLISSRLQLENDRSNTVRGVLCWKCYTPSFLTSYTYAALGITKGPDLYNGRLKQAARFPRAGPHHCESFHFQKLMAPSYVTSRERRLWFR